MQNPNNNLIQPGTPRVENVTHWPSIWQFSLGLLAVFLLWSTALGVVLLGLVQVFGSTPSEALPMFMSAAAMIVAGVLLLPSAGLALLRMIRGPASMPARMPRIFTAGLRPTLLIFTLPIVLLLGYLVAREPAIAWLALPPFHVLAVALPVMWLLYLGLRGLPAGSPQRTWGIFSSGLVLGPALIMLLELAVVVGFFVLAVVWFASQPDLANDLIVLSQRLDPQSASPEEMRRVLEPYLALTPVVFSVFSFLAVIVPLIEEALKPIGVWLLAWRGLTPREGFVGGLISGAGYALFESLLLSSSGEDWAFLVLARIGTGIIHVLTTGLTGWALALAWKEGRYLRLGLTYLVAVAIHGLWNGLTVLTSYSGLLHSRAEEPLFALAIRVGSIAPFALVWLAFSSLATLILLNRAMRRTEQPALVEIMDSSTPA